MKSILGRRVQPGAGATGRSSRWRRLAVCVGVCVGLGLLVAGSVAGCERALVIPSGAQTVHATVTRDSVRLEPATVHAGMVYLTVDSNGPELMLIGAVNLGGGGEPDPPGLVGLTDEHLDAVLHGDVSDTYRGPASVAAASWGTPASWAIIGRKYLFLPDGIVILEPGAYDAIPLGATAVLEVVP